MRQAHRRQEELERTNSELVRNLVDKDREVDLLRQPLMSADLTTPTDPRESIDE